MEPDICTVEQDKPLSELLVMKNAGALKSQTSTAKNFYFDTDKGALKK